jgi:hypothetical protein
LNASDEPGGLRYAVFEQVFEADSQGKRIWWKLPVERKVRHSEALHGVAPDCLLVSLKVLDDEGQGTVSDVIAALQWAVASISIRSEIAPRPRRNQCWLRLRCADVRVWPKPALCGS